MRRPNPLRRLPGNAACQKTRFSPLFLGKFRPLRKPGSRFWGFLLVFLISWGEMIFSPPRFYFYFLFFLPLFIISFRPAISSASEDAPRSPADPPLPRRGLTPQHPPPAGTKRGKIPPFWGFPLLPHGAEGEILRPVPPPQPVTVAQGLFWGSGGFRGGKSRFHPQNATDGERWETPLFWGSPGTPRYPHPPPPSPKGPVD